MRVSRLLGEFALITVALLWSGTFLLIKRALPWCDPVTFVTVRFALATLAAAIVWHSKLSQLRHTIVWRHGLVLGVTYAVGFYLQTWGLLHTTIARSAFFTGTFVVFVPLLQRIVWRRHPTAREWWGVALGLMGIAFLSSPESGSLNRGDVATLIGTLIWSYYMGYLSYAGVERLSVIGTGALVVLQCGVTAVLGGIIHTLTSVVGHDLSSSLGYLRLSWTADVIIALLYTSLFASVLATYVQTRVQPGISAVRAALIFAMEPVFATLLGVIAHGEHLHLSEVIGALMIVGAAVIPSFTVERAMQ